MSTPKKEQDQTEEATVQVDVYGIRIPVTPAENIEPSPRTWKEVGRRASRDLKRVAGGLLGVVAETVEGLQRLIRGTSSLPKSISERIAAAHRQAQAHEESKGHDRLRAESEHAGGQDAVDRLNKKLEDLRAKGFAAAVVHDRDGNPVVFVVRPDQIDLLPEVVRQALSPSTESETENPESTD